MDSVRNPNQMRRYVHMICEFAIEHNEQNLDLAHRERVQWESSSVTRRNKSDNILSIAMFRKSKVTTTTLWQIGGDQ